MTKGKPRISKFHPVVQSTSSSFSEDVKHLDLRRNVTTWDDGNGFMNPFGATNAQCQSVESSALPYQPLYRDATGISLSMLSLDGNMEFVSTEQNRDPMDTGPWLQPFAQDRSVKSSNLTSTAPEPVPKVAETTWQDMLPAGFPIPPSGRSKMIRAKTTLVKPRSKQVVPPIVSEKTVRSKGKGPSRSDGLLGGHTSIDSIKDTATRETIEAQNFQIRHFDKVTSYMREKLLLLQQQALKKVGKAWIKALCPKKQSRYPYSAKRKRDGTDQSPSWWPPTNVCPHKEPDHIASEHRINLLIHLLRLRPSPGELDAWIGHSTEPKGPPALRAHEWTASLRDLTPLSIFDEITREPPHKVERRPKLLEDLFRIAQLEEEMMIGGNDGTDMIAWIPDSEVKTRPKRRTDEAPAVIVGERAASIMEIDQDTNDVDSSDESQRSVKKQKRDTRGQKAKLAAKVKKAGQRKKKKPPVVHTPSSSTTEELTEQARDPFDPIAHNASTLGNLDRSMIARANSSVTTSFGSSTSTDIDWNPQWYEPRRVVGVGDSAYQNIAHHHNPQINSAYDLTHPQFAATPGAQYFHGSNFGMVQHASASTQGQIQSPEEKAVWTMLSHGGSRPFDMLTPQMTTESRQQGAIPSNEAQPAAHMMARGQWQPFAADFTAPFHAQHGHPYGDIANMHVAPAMLVHPEWHSQYHPALRRPHGLPVQYDEGSNIEYVPPAPALPAQHHHFSR